MGLNLNMPKALNTVYHITVVWIQNIPKIHKNLLTNYYSMTNTPTLLLRRTATLLVRFLLKSNKFEIKINTTVYIKNLPIT